MRRASQHDDECEKREGSIFGAILQVSRVQLSPQVQGCRDQTHDENPVNQQFLTLGKAVERQVSKLLLKQDHDKCKRQTVDTEEDERCCQGMLGLLMLNLSHAG